MLVIDKRKAKNRDMNIPPPKDNARICIDARDLNKALKRTHFPMVTVEEVVKMRRASHPLKPAVGTGNRK